MMIINFCSVICINTHAKSMQKIPLLLIWVVVVQITRFAFRKFIYWHHGVFSFGRRRQSGDREPSLFWRTSKTSSETLSQTRRAVLCHDSLGLVVVVLRDRTIALLVIKGHRSQTVQFATEFLDHGLEMQVFLFQTASFFLDRLDLLALAGAALCCCDLIFLPVALFPFGGAVVGCSGALALLTVFACLFSFAVSLVRCIAGTAGFVALNR